MSKLMTCTECHGFMVAGRCPNCGASARSLRGLGAVGSLLGGSVFAMTLMACYGCPDGSCGSDLPDARVGADARVGSDAAPDANRADSDAVTDGATTDASPDGDAGPEDAATLDASRDP